MLGIEYLTLLFQEKCYLRFFQLICDVTDDIANLEANCESG